MNQVLSRTRAKVTVAVAAADRDVPRGLESWNFISITTWQQEESHSSLPAPDFVIERPRSWPDQPPANVARDARSGAPQAAVSKTTLARTTAAPYATLACLTTADYVASRQGSLPHTRATEIPRPLAG